MACLLDANVLISAQNQHYGFDFCPGFWDWLVEANAARRVHRIEAVYDELVARDDDLTAWARAHREFFLPTTRAELEAIGVVNRWATNSPDYEPTAKHEFARVADSFLIGHAVAGGHTVVTHEVISDTRKRIKIPNAAIANGVRCMDPFQMLRTEGVRFVLDTSGP